MSESFSLDTNLLVYAADGQAGERHVRALDIIVRASRRSCILTIQALGEFFHTTRRKRVVPQREAVAQVQDFMDLFATVSADRNALRVALSLAEAGALSFWDALLLATVGRAGCTFLLSEDMQDRARFAGVTVLNPFAGETLPAPVAALLD